MIPEKVEWVTSMTTGHSRDFSTPVGSFAYFQRNAADYPVGVESSDSGTGGFPIARREKAIYDKALTDRRFTGSGIREYPSEDLRLEEEALPQLNRETPAEPRNVCATS